jgi:hypothetical protein
MVFMKPSGTHPQADGLSARFILRKPLMGGNVKSTARLPFLAIPPFMTSLKRIDPNQYMDSRSEKEADLQAQLACHRRAEWTIFHSVLLALGQHVDLNQICVRAYSSMVAFR